MADFQNPQQEPGSERRLLLVFVLTFVVILLFQPLLKKYGPQTPATPPQTQPAKTPTSDSLSSSSSVADVNAVVVPPVIGTRQARSETETVIETDLYRVTFTNRGGQVKSWILKKFNNEAQNGPLDLVNPLAAAKYGYPLSLWTYDEALRNKLGSVLYVASSEGTQGAPADITFEYSDPDLSVRKTFHFDRSYVLHLETAVTYKGASVAALPAWPSGFGDQTTPATYAASLIDYQYNGNIERLALKKISSGATIPGPLHWAGPTDQYFAAVFIPDDPASTSLVTLHNSIDNPQDAKRPFDVVGAAAGNLRGPTTERVFIGPKELSSLEAVPVPGITGTNPDLRGLVDFGWWGILARPLFLWLKWTYNHVVANWGWAIVLQTLIIAVALLPLRVSQMKSMLKMQRVAPQIKSIQEKYKKYSLRDPRKAAMNEEISALYKKEGVNPAGGCLPLVIQMPFLFAYYRMLGTALDLRHAHWLWIHDLSARDPLFLLPIGMVISMLVTQRMTPQAGMDPAQQKMMTWMMPLMMGFIFFNLPAGLNLYYAESNLISIAQQAVMNRTTLGREMREMMEKRARKKEK
ncbi:MAG TPA: membrane protein insertase YidC [Candidatus Sulfotelmatobacter sp.]